jgi:hypothetical protein
MHIDICRDPRGIQSMIKFIKNNLIEGDAIDPSSTDLIAQVGRLDVGEAVPDGWRVLTGEAAASRVSSMKRVARVVMRGELED